MTNEEIRAIALEVAKEVYGIALMFIGGFASFRNAPSIDVVLFIANVTGLAPAQEKTK